MFRPTFLYKQKKCQRHDWDLIQRHSGMAPRVCSELFRTTTVHSAMGTLVELTTAFLLKTGRSRFMPPSVKLDLCIPGLYVGPSSLDREAIDQALWSIAPINGGDRKHKIYEWWLLISTIKRLHYNDYSMGDILAADVRPMDNCMVPPYTHQIRGPYTWYIFDVNAK